MLQSGHAIGACHSTAVWCVDVCMAHSSKHKRLSIVDTLSPHGRILLCGRVSRTTAFVAGCAGGGFSGCCVVSSELLWRLCPPLPHVGLAHYERVATGS